MIKALFLSICLLALPESFGYGVEDRSEDSSPTTTTPFSIVNETHTDDINLKTEEKPNANSKIQHEATVWKIETAFAESKIPLDNDTITSDSQEQTTVDEIQNKTKEFKPSQHLGDFFDTEDAEPKYYEKDAGFTPIIKKPVSFKGYQKPQNTFKFSPPKSPSFPYKYEKPVLTKTKIFWKEPEPSIPAGGLYKTNDPFKDKPAAEDLGLDFSPDFKESVTSVKKRRDGWQGVLRLLTAFIPVGLIISALTPHVITVENVGETQPYSNRFVRGAGPPPPAAPADSPPVFSERCRRRLLCELQVEQHYVRSAEHKTESSAACSRFRCEQQSLGKMLSWLLQPRTSRPAKGSWNNIT